MRGAPQRWHSSCLLISEWWGLQHGRGSPPSSHKSLGGLRLNFPLLEEINSKFMMKGNSLVAGFASSAAASSSAAATSTGVLATHVGVWRRLQQLQAQQDGSLWRGTLGKVFQSHHHRGMPLSTAAASVTQATAASSSATLRGAATASTVLMGSEALCRGLSLGARRQLTWWLGGTAAWVYSMVVIGGITRLTRSGLSMTEWKFTGERPPLSREDWQAQYDKYRQSPEFKKVHSSMTLEEFKFIFWMEYGHRMWGRVLGLAFVLPCAYFLARGYVNGALAQRLGLLFFMGGTQGLVGWWMVRSGLEEPTKEWERPRVSPYRLAAHLVSAFSIYSVLVWTALDLAPRRYEGASPAAGGGWGLGGGRPLMATVAQEAAAAARVVRSRVLPFAALVAVTAASGAFVAGLDAGRAYNTFPLMQGRWFPEEYWGEGLQQQRRSEGGEGFSAADLLRNAFENTAAAQWHHRVLATLTATTALALWPWVRASAAPLPVKRCMDLVAGITVAQFCLGIWTLLEAVPVPLGSAHQANALNLFTAVLLTLHALRPAQPGPVVVAVGRFAAPAAILAVAGIGIAVTNQR